MKFLKHVALLLLVAGVAYLLGRTGTFGGIESTAMAAAQDHPEHPKATKQEHPEHPKGEHPGADGEGPTPEEMAMMLAGTPGDHHKMLNCMIGTWEGTYTMRMGPDAEPMSITGVATREWVLNEHYIKETIRSEFEGQPFEGISYIGYNNIDGVYEFIWMDNMSTGIYRGTMSIDPDTMVMHSRGESRDPLTKQIVYMHGEIDMSNPDRHVSSDWATGADGKSYKMFWGVSERVKK